MFALGGLPRNLGRLEYSIDTPERMATIVLTGGRYNYGHNHYDYNQYDEESCGFCKQSYQVVNKNMPKRVYFQCGHTFHSTCFMHNRGTQVHNQQQRRKRKHKKHHHGYRKCPLCGCKEGKCKKDKGVRPDLLNSNLILTTASSLINNNTNNVVNNNSRSREKKRKMDELQRLLSKAQRTRNELDALGERCNRILQSYPDLLSSFSSTPSSSTPSSSRPSSSSPSLSFSSLISDDYTQMFLQRIRALRADMQQDNYDNNGNNAIGENDDDDDVPEVTLIEPPQPTTTEQEQPREQQQQREKETCSICCEDFEDYTNSFTFHCSPNVPHRFHHTCMERFLSHGRSPTLSNVGRGKKEINCPLCRKSNVVYQCHDCRMHMPQDNATHFTQNSRTRGLQEMITESDDDFDDTNTFKICFKCYIEKSYQNE